MRTVASLVHTVVVLYITTVPLSLEQEIASCAFSGSVWKFRREVHCTNSWYFYVVTMVPIWQKTDPNSIGDWQLCVCELWSVPLTSDSCSLSVVCAVLRASQCTCGSARATPSSTHHWTGRLRPLSPTGQVVSPAVVCLQSQVVSSKQAKITQEMSF